jgi:MFS family permease
MAYGVALSLAILSAASLTSIAYSANAPLIRLSFNLTEVEVGAIASCMYFGAAASSISAGRLTDSLGAGPVLAMSMLALVVGGAVSAVAPNALLFFAGLLVAGLGYGAVNPPTNVLADPSNPRRRALSMSIKQSGIPLGGIVAGLVVPLVAVATHWRWSLLIPIAACAALALVSARLPRGSAAPPDDGPAHPLAAIRLPHAFIYGFLLAGIQVAIFVFLAVYLVDDRGFRADEAGAALALLLLGGLVGRPTWGWVSDWLHHDRVRVLQAAGVLSAAFMVLLPFAGGPLIYPVLFGIGLCAVGWNGVFLAMVNEAVPPALIGSTSGVSFLLVNLGAVVVPPLVGLLVALGTGWSFPWFACAAVTLVSIAILQAGRTPPMLARVQGGPAGAV